MFGSSLSGRLLGGSIKKPWLSIAPSTIGHSVQKRHIIRLPNLPFNLSEGVHPVFSPRSTDFHYSIVHHRYCIHLNRLLEASGQELKPLEDIIVFYRQFHTHAHIYNTASMIYNHTFMWLSISPYGVCPSKWMQAYMNTHFGSLERFKKLWKASCLASFGSGWCRLIDSDGRLEIVNSVNAANPVGRAGIQPILVIDLWEHAYALDYGQDVEAYVDNWMKAINWEFAETMARRVSPSTQITPHPTTLRTSTDFGDIQPLPPKNVSAHNEAAREYERYLDHVEDE